MIPTFHDNKQARKVALYARVSTEEQTENFSLGAQVDLLKKYAKDCNFEVFDEYVDGGFSGTKADRPQFQRLLEDARRRKFDLILIYKIDRFFRNNRHLLNVVSELETHGIFIKSVTEPFDTSSNMGKFMLSLFGSVAELERNNFIERSKMGKLRRVKEGYYGGCSRPKYGYKYNKTTKQIELNEKESAIVKFVFAEYNEPNGSLMAVAKKLRALGHKTRDRKEFGADTVHRIVSDPMYMGKWVGHTYDYSSNRPLPKEQWVEVEVPAIVSADDYSKAIKQLELRRNHSERNVKYQYLLQGICKCKDCGGSVAGTADKTHSVINGKKYGPYFTLYYRCTSFSRNKYGTEVVKCNLRYMNGEDLETAAWDAIKNFLRNPELIEKYFYEESLGAKWQNDKNNEVEKIKKEIGQLNASEQRILEAYRNEIISIDQLRDQIKIVTDQKNGFIRQKEELEKKVVLSLDNKSKIKNVKEFVEVLRQKLDSVSYETKKNVLKILRARIDIYRNADLDIRILIPVTNPPKGTFPTKPFFPIQESQVKVSSLPDYPALRRKDTCDCD